MIKIGLDAGHYVGDDRVPDDFVAFLGTRDEYTLNLKAYKTVYERLKAAGFAVVDIGKQDRNVVSRARRAASEGCNLLISLHHNAGRGKGCTIFRHSNGVMGSQSKRLQESLYKYLKSVNAGNRSNPIASAELGVINCSNAGCPAVLIELAFMDAHPDVDYIVSENFYGLVADAIVSGVREYCGEEAPAPAKNPAKVVKSYNPPAYGVVKGLKSYDPYLNVRTSAGTKYPILRTLANGNEIDVLAITESGWAKVNIVGLVGYVDADYLDIFETGKPQTVRVVNCSALNIRISPNGKIKTSVPVGTELVVFGTKKDSDGDTWTKVQHGDVIGYVWPKYTE